MSGIKNCQYDGDETVNMLKTKWDVLVVGAGAGGLALAILLAKKGLQVGVLEGQATPMGRPRGEIIQPNGLRILDEIGVLSPLLEGDVFRWDRVNFNTENGNLLCSVCYQNLPLPFNFALVVLPEEVNRHLLSKIASFPNIQIFYKATLLSLLQEGGQGMGIRARIENESYDFQAKVVIGGDGVRSFVRDAIRIQSRVRTYANGYLTTMVNIPQDFSPDTWTNTLKNLNFFLGKWIYFAVMPAGKRQLYLMYLIRGDQQERIKTEGIDRFKEKILSINRNVRALLEKPLSEISSWSDFSFMPCFHVHCKSWVADGGALIGDAAHAMNPHVAQGRNAAMQDAWILSGVIEACFHRGDFSRRALADYELQRRPEVSALQRTADELTWLLESGSPPLIWARERIFRAIHKSPALHDKILFTASGVESRPFNLLDKWRSLHLFGPV